MTKQFSPKAKKKYHSWRAVYLWQENDPCKQEYFAYMVSAATENCLQKTCCLELSDKLLQNCKALLWSMSFSWHIFPNIQVNLFKTRWINIWILILNISFPLYLQCKKSCQQPLLIIRTKNAVRTLDIPLYTHVLYLIKNSVAPFFVKACTPYFSWYTKSHYYVHFHFNYHILFVQR